MVEEEENNFVGEIKVWNYLDFLGILERQKLILIFNGTFKMYSVLENSCNIADNLILKNVLPMGREECVLRVYVIRGVELQAKDSNGKVTFSTFNFK